MCVCVWLQLDLDSSAGLNKVQFKAWLPNIALGGPFCNCTSGFNCKVDWMFPRAGTYRTCQSITRFNDFQDFLWLMACKALLKNLTNEEEHSIQQPYMLCIAVHLWPNDETRCRHVADTLQTRCGSEWQELFSDDDLDYVLNALSDSQRSSIIQHHTASYSIIQHPARLEACNKCVQPMGLEANMRERMEKTHFGVSN